MVDQNVNDLLNFINTPIRRKASVKKITLPDKTERILSLEISETDLSAGEAIATTTTEVSSVLDCGHFRTDENIGICAECGAILCARCLIICQHPKCRRIYCSNHSKRSIYGSFCIAHSRADLAKRIVILIGKVLLFPFLDFNRR